jgi:hypothetical protein
VVVDVELLHDRLLQRRVVGHCGARKHLGLGYRAEDRVAADPPRDVHSFDHALHVAGGAEEVVLDDRRAARVTVGEAHPAGGLRLRDGHGEDDGPAGGALRRVGEMGGGHVQVEVAWLGFRRRCPQDGASGRMHAVRRGLEGVDVVVEGMFLQVCTDCRSARTGMARSRRCAAGPMPERMRIAGLP